MKIIHKKFSNIILGLCSTFDAVYILSYCVYANETFTLFSLIYIFELSETFCVRLTSKQPTYFLYYQFVILVHIHGNSL